MSRKKMLFLVSVLLISFLILPVSGQAIPYIADKAGLLSSRDVISSGVSNPAIPYIADKAGLLTPEEITSLEEKAAELASEYNMDPVILTVDSLYGSSAQDYADDYYDSHGYREDGVLFLLAMAEREWCAAHKSSGADSKQQGKICSTSRLDAEHKV